MEAGNNISRKPQINTGDRASAARDAAAVNGDAFDADAAASPTPPKTFDDFMRDQADVDRALIRAHYGSKGGAS